MEWRPTLLLLTGTLCDARLWEGVSAHLERPCSIIVPGSDPGASTCQTEAARLLARLSSPVTLVGFSLGGLVALEMVAQRPDLVANLTLVSAGAGVDPPQVAQTRRDQLAFARGHGLSRMVRETLWPLYKAGTASDEGPLLKTLVAMAEGVGLETFARQTKIALTRTDSRPRLHRILMPVLLISGERDPLCPPARHQELRAKLPHARVVCLSDCGHFSPLEQPEALAAMLSRDFEE